MDLIVGFHHGSMKRVADRPPPELAAFFGDDPDDPEWHRVYELARRTGGFTSRALLDHYETQLRRIGYVWFRDEVVVEVGNNGAPLYHVLFATKHERGEDFWAKISSKRSDGQLRLGL